MRTKVPLTPEYVDAAEPPPTGERWISDTEVKGFGLRLWSGTTTGSKAYALRNAKLTVSLGGTETLASAPPR